MDGIFSIFILAVSMLVMMDIDIAGLRLSVLLFFLLTAAWTFCRAVRVREGGGWFRMEYRVDLAAIILFLYGLFSFIGKLFQNPARGEIRYQFQVMLIVCIVLYFLWKEAQEFSDWYFDLILYGALIGMAAFLFYHLCDDRAAWLATELLGNSEKAASYLMVPCLVSTAQYCVCRDKMRSFFYLLTALTGFFCLMLNHNVVSFWIMVMALLSIPVIFRPAAQLVKRDMQLLFMFFFLLGNMGPLTNFLELFREITVFEMKYSLYVGLMLASGGIFFFYYWRRIPEGADLGKLVLRKMGKGYLFILKMAGIIFAGIVLSGNGIAVLLAEEIGAEPSGFAQIFNNDLAGMLMLLVVIILLMERIGKNYSADKPTTNIFLLMTVVFFGQCFFWTPSVNVLPVYTMMAVMAAFYKEKNGKCSGIKTNISGRIKENENSRKNINGFGNADGNDFGIMEYSADGSSRGGQ